MYWLVPHICSMITRRGGVFQLENCSEFHALSHNLFGKNILAILLFQLDHFIPKCSLRSQILYSIIMECAIWERYLWRVSHFLVKEQAGNNFGHFLIESAVLNLLLISLSESGRKCNTREKRQIYRTDTITITDRSKLPIREFYTGDVDLANEMTYIRVSHLQCIGLITFNFTHIRS